MAKIANRGTWRLYRRLPRWVYRPLGVLGCITLFGVLGLGVTACSTRTQQPETSFRLNCTPHRGEVEYATRGSTVAVSGVVVIPSGTASDTELVAGVKIELRAAGADESLEITYTDRTGAFSIPGIGSGRYDLSVSYDAFLTGHYEIVVKTEQGRTRQDPLWICLELADIFC